MKRLAIALLALAVATLAAISRGGAPVPAVAAGPTASQPAADAPLSASKKQHDAWVRKIRAARDAVAAAERRSEAARLSYAAMMRHHTVRGDKKAKVIKERDESLAALDGARRDMDALLERAHRSGVPPGWVREGLGEVQKGPGDAPAAPRK